MTHKEDYPFTEKELRRAAQTVMEAYPSPLPAPEECRHEFSPAFQEKMEPVLRQAERREHRRKQRQRAACVFLALLLGSALWLSADQKARAGFLAWVQETYENAVYLFSGRQAEDSAPEEAPACRFTWLPEGFSVEEALFPEEDRHRFTAVLTAAGREDTLFSCEISYDDWSLSLDYDESYRTESVTVGESAGKLYLCPDGSRPTSLVWQAEDGGLILYLTGYLSQDELLRVARGVVLER